MNDEVEHVDVDNYFYLNRLIRRIVIHNDCHHLLECIEVDGKYMPLDMPGEGRTVTDSASACQDRCLNTEGCSYFSWWNDGGCHIQDSSAVLTSGAGASVHYGPKSCTTGIFARMCFLIFSRIFYIIISLRKSYSF